MSSRLVCLLLIAICCSRISVAQIKNVTDDTSAPIPGAGHDYIHLLNETVNPSNGSVSVSIQVPLPKGRGLTLPFSIAYNSNGVNHLTYAGNGQAIWVSNTSYLAQGGWSYTLPSLSFVEMTSPSPQGTCYWGADYVFSDASGAAHALYLEVGGSSYFSNGGGLVQCGTNIINAGDVQYHATAQAGCSNGCGFSPTPVSVSDPDGTVYYFPGGGYSQGHSTYAVPASTIEDRNGNKIAVSSNANKSITLTDTVGRPVLSASGFGPSGSTNSITVSGLSQAYEVAWETTAPNYTVPSNPVGSDSLCSGIPSVTSTLDSLTVVQSITLPNGEAYQFSYDSTYGLLNEIIYPGHGWVKYTWKPSDQFSEIAVYPDSSGNQTGCIYQYKPLVVGTRTVSFDGSSAALTQSFQYATNWTTGPTGGASWTSKTTTVTTTDNIRNTSFTTTYTYTPYNAPSQPSDNPEFAPQIPLESQIQYYDWSATGNLLITKTKSWLDLYRLQSEQTAVDVGVISNVTYPTYSAGVGPQNSGSQPTEIDEYDFGATSPTRKTIINYQNLSNTLGIITDRPCQRIVYDGSGNRVAETDYLYDGGTTVCGASGSASTIAVPNLPQGTHDEANFSSTSTTPRGNATSVIQLCLQSCANAATTLTYDETGQALSMTDPCGNATCSDMSGTNHTTTYSYVDNYASGTGTPPGQTNAYLTQITYPNTGVAHTESFSWGYNDGQLRSSTDQNSQTTTYTYNTPPSGCIFPDGFDRLSSITYPDTGKTTYCYNDAPYNSSTPSPSVTTSKAINSSANLTTLIAFDGLGHVKQTQLTSDPQGTVYADTTYDALGRVWKQSNPYRSGSAPTDGTTTYIYDALGRNCVVVPPDGSAVTNNTCPATHPANDVLTVYVGNTTTVTDQYGIKRRSVTDALGRLTQVFEDPSGLNYETDYAYDALDNLLCTAQKGTNSGTFTNCASIPAAWRPRTFTYDPLSRLLSATNPESGNITYSYDANGNLATKTAPAPNQTSSATVTTTYSYDALNRLTQKSYSDSSTPAPTPTAYFLYDLVNPWGSTYPNNSYIGRLDETITKNGLGTWLTSSYFLHDPMGRITKIGQCTPTHCATGFHTVYTYDLMGDLASFRTIENNITFTYSYNAAGRPIKVTSSLADANHPATLATVNASIGYWAFGGLHMLTLGNGLTETAVFNSRLQPCRMNVNSSGGWYNQCTAPLASGNVQDFTYGFSLGSSDNGNLTSFSASGARTFNRTYSYGQLNRLSSMSAPSDPSGCTGLSWTYDPWSNRSDQTVTSGTCGTFHASITTKNQLYDPVHNIYQYDAAGNMTYDGSHTYFYDAENRTIQVGGTLGNCSTATACYAYDAQGNRVQKAVGSAVTQYVLNTSGQVIHEADGSGNFATYYIFFGTKLLAQYKNSTTQFIHKDHLGSTRLVTGMTNPSSPVDALDYLPFGEQITGDTSTTHKFTGKERDSESGNDNFGARYYGSGPGRFLSPDPGNVGADRWNPQSWNAYSYTDNNPLSRIDANGLDYSVCLTDESGGQTCTYVPNERAFQKALNNPGPGISVSGDANSGTIYVTDQNGNQVEEGTYERFAGPGNVAAEAIEHDYAMDLLMVSPFAGLFRGSVIGGTSTAASGVWSLGWSLRGQVIEQMLGKNLPDTFPVIDAFENGVATSIKSIDLTAATYQAPDALATKLTGYVDNLASFQGGNVGTVSVDAAQVTGKVLKLAVPEGGATAAQQVVIDRVAAQAAQAGVKVVVVRVR